MKTNFKEHLAWGILLLPPVFYYFCDCDISLKSIVFLMNFLAGSVFPDLDLCLSLRKIPRVKMAVCMIKLISALFIISPLNKDIIFVFAASVLWANFYLLIDCIQQTGLFMSIGCKPNGYHRDSLFHSLSFWYFCLFFIQKEVLQLFPLTDGMVKSALITISSFCLKPLSYGAIAHIFLDHFGSLIEHKNYFTFFQLLSTIFFIIFVEFFMIEGFLFQILQTLKTTTLSKFDI